MNGFVTIVSGAVLIAGGAAGMAFGVLDPITGATLVTNGLAMLGVNSKLTQVLQGQKEKEINFHVPKEE